MENNLTEYNDKNRITYSEEDDTLYVLRARVKGNWVR